MTEVGAFQELEAGLGPGEEVVDLLLGLLAESGFDVGLGDVALAAHQLAQALAGLLLLDQQLVELGAGDLAGADQDLAEGACLPRADGNEAHPLGSEVDRLLHLPLGDGQQARALALGEVLQQICEAEDRDVTPQFTH